MRAIIVNPFDPLPWESKRRGRYGQLASRLVARGHEVLWITADFRHTTKQYREWPPSFGSEGLEIIPIHVPPYSRNMGLARVVSHRVYASKLEQTLSRIGSAVDVVIASIPPTESARVAMVFSAKAGVPGIVDMQDAWPRVLELAFPAWMSQFPGTILLWPFRRDVKSAASLASGLVAVSQEYLDYLIAFRTSASQTAQAVFPLGFDTSELQIPPAKPWREPSDSFVASYIGTFGHFYDLETVVRAAHLSETYGIKFILIGDGPAHNHIVQLAKDLGLENVCLKGHMAFERAVPLLLQSSVGLVPIRADWPPNIPNKAFDYLFLGLPVISSVKGSFETTLSEVGCGVPYEAGNPDSLAEALVTLAKDPQKLAEMGRKGMEYARAHMDGCQIYRQYSEFIEQQAADNGLVLTKQ